MFRRVKYAIILCGIWRNIAAVNIVSSQWRMPVETQNLASPEEVKASCSSYNQCVVIAFVACETQDFASLLLVCGVMNWLLVLCRGGVVGQCGCKNSVVRLLCWDKFINFAVI